MSESSIYSTLSNDSGVSNLVSSRIYPNRRPQDSALPSIMYFRAVTNPENELKGGAGIDQIRYQIESYGATFSDARSVADAVRTAMEGAGHYQVDEFTDYMDGPDVYRVVTDYHTWF